MAEGGMVTIRWLTTIPVRHVCPVAGLTAFGASTATPVASRGAVPKTSHSRGWYVADALGCIPCTLTTAVSDRCCHLIPGHASAGMHLGCTVTGDADAVGTQELPTGCSK